METSKYIHRARAPYSFALSAARHAQYIKRELMQLTASRDINLYRHLINIIKTVFERLMAVARHLLYRYRQRCGVWATINMHKFIQDRAEPDLAPVVIIN